MSFHGAGGNVGDTSKVPLPEWVLNVGDENPDIFYTDRQGFRNREYLSLGCDEERVFWGRTPVEMYRDFVDAFVSNFSSLIGGSVCVHGSCSTSHALAGLVGQFCAIHVHICPLDRS